MSVKDHSDKFSVLPAIDLQGEIARVRTAASEDLRAAVERFAERLIKWGCIESANLLIEVLDLWDGDADLEPSLCGIPFGGGDPLDLEDEHDGREPEPLEDDRGVTIDVFRRLGGV